MKLIFFSKLIKIVVSKQHLVNMIIAFFSRQTESTLARTGRTLEHSVLPQGVLHFFSHCIACLFSQAFLFSFARSPVRKLALTFIGFIQG